MENASAQRKRPVVRMVSATEAKNRFGAVIKRAYLDQEHLIVERGGVPVVVIIPLADYEGLITPEELPIRVAEAVTNSREQQLARHRLSEFLDQVHAKMPAVSEEEAEKDIQEAVQAVRARQ